MLFVSRHEHVLVTYILVREYWTNPLGLILYVNMPENFCLCRYPMTLRHSSFRLQTRAE
jgi:hypothetical protein